MIQGEDGQKMSKSRGNVINPDDVVTKYGADSFRLYEMFMGPLDKSKPWNTKGLQGCYRFLSKVWRLFNEKSKNIKDNCSSKETDMLLNQTIKKVSEDIEGLKFNTSVSQLMIFTNHLTSLKELDSKVLHVFLQLLNPFAPHISEELNQKILKNGDEPLSSGKWPEYDDSLLDEDLYTIAVQINGKMRGTIDINSELQEDQITEIIFSDPKFRPYFEKMDIIKKIYVPNKLLNFVLKEIISLMKILFLLLFQTISYITFKEP